MSFSDYVSPISHQIFSKYLQYSASKGNGLKVSTVTKFRSFYQFLHHRVFRVLCSSFPFRLEGGTFAALFYRQLLPPNCQVGDLLTKYRRACKDSRVYSFCYRPVKTDILPFLTSNLPDNKV